MKRIGIIDSGIGGLTVAQEVMIQLPLESICYFGDTLRCPYGDRTDLEIKEFVHQIVDFVMQKDLKALLIACNTATAFTLDEIQESLPIPVLGVIEPGARAALRATRNNRIGILATTATTRSGAYERVLRRMQPDLLLFPLACPEFVGLVESGNRNSLLAYERVRDRLLYFNDLDIDTVILGCTHYPLLAEAIGAALGSEVQIISSAYETACELRVTLEDRGMLSLINTENTSEHLFFTTGSPEKFIFVAEEWLGKAIGVEHVELANYSSKP